MYRQIQKDSESVVKHPPNKDRLGMLHSNNEEKRNNNIAALGDTVTELIKQMYAKNPKKINAPKISKINSSESYSITKLGRQYLDFIDEPKQKL